MVECINDKTLIHEECTLIVIWDDLLDLLWMHPSPSINPIINDNSCSLVKWSYNLISGGLYVLR
jgi:hypothetical protein